jgi:hypothetical protein
LGFVLCCVVLCFYVVLYCVVQSVVQTNFQHERSYAMAANAAYTQLSARTFLN